MNKILYLGNKSGVISNLMTIIEKLEFRFEITECFFLSDAENNLRNNQYDAVWLSDEKLPDSINIVDSVQQLISAYDQSNIIVISNIEPAESYDLYGECLDHGAQDIFIVNYHRPYEIIDKIFLGKKRIEFETDTTRSLKNKFGTDHYRSLFLSSMGHDLRSPLSMMINTVPLLRKSEKDEKKLKILDLLESAANKQLRTIDDILEFTKLQNEEISANEEGLELGELLSECIDKYKEMAKEKQLSLTYKIAEDISSYINSDRELLKKVLLNLIDNAIKFTKEGEISVSVISEENQLHFEVKDTGIGIAGNRLNEIFIPFEQTDIKIKRLYGGSGLGLSICSELLRLLDGKIFVQSEIGKGSSFYFYIPYKISENAHDSDNDEIGFEYVGPQRRVLIVDDSEDNHLLLSHFFEDSPLIISKAMNGKEAIDLFKSEFFDIILMDIQMDIVDGYDAVRLIRQLEIVKGRKKTPILAFTAAISEEDIRKCFEVGCDDFVCKPYRKEEIIKKFNKYLA